MVLCSSVRREQFRLFRKIWLSMLFSFRKYLSSFLWKLLQKHDFLYLPPTASLKETLRQIFLCSRLISCLWKMELQAEKLNLSIPFQRLYQLQKMYCEKDYKVHYI